MLPFVKILSSRSASDLTLSVNQYLNTIQSQSENGCPYSLRSIDFKVVPLPDLGVMYTVLIIIDDATASEYPEGYPTIDIPF